MPASVHTFTWCNRTCVEYLNVRTCVRVWVIGYVCGYFRACADMSKQHSTLAKRPVQESE